MTIAKISQFNNAHCVYQIRDASGQIIYIGTSKLKEAYDFPDARTNTEFHKLPVEVAIEVKVLYVGEAHDCANTAYALRMQHQPPCNVRGRSTRQMKKRIMCNETGEIFASLSDAARAHNIAASALSSHINQKRSCRTVHGRTYSRVEQTHA